MILVVNQIDSNEDLYFIKLYLRISSLLISDSRAITSARRKPNRKSVELHVICTKPAIISLRRPPLRDASYAFLLWTARLSIRLLMLLARFFLTTKRTFWPISSAGFCDFLSKAWHHTKAVNRRVKNGERFLLRSFMIQSLQWLQRKLIGRKEAIRIQFPFYSSQSFVFFLAVIEAGPHFL